MMEVYLPLVSEVLLADSGWHKVKEGTLRMDTAAYSAGGKWLGGGSFTAIAFVEDAGGEYVENPATQTLMIVSLGAVRAYRLKVGGEKAETPPGAPP